MNLELAKSEEKSWDPLWEDLFKKQAWGKYPPEELIRFIARNYYSAADRKQIQLLELGCGAGACIWYSAREGFQVTGIDGSPAALKRAQDLLKSEDLEADLLCGDIIDLEKLVGAKQFDAIFDIGCLQCNKYSNIKRIVDSIYNKLKPGGKFFSIMVSQDDSAVRSGREIEPGTYVDISEGCLKERGLNHICTQAEIDELFARFEKVEIDFTRRTFFDRALQYDNWICSGTKPIK